LGSGPFLTKPHGMDFDWQCGLGERNASRRAQPNP
jgi:hypothetical protein